MCSAERSLKAFAGNLVAHDPKERPSLLEWDRYLAPPFSDSDASKTLQLRRDRVEGDGEMTKPNVKKQRLDSGLGGLRGGYGPGLMVGAARRTCEVATPLVPTWRLYDEQCGCDFMIIA
ncbi:hypothetical protein JVT61DRAFT_12399 [Boletus reticuloceps]|uniref:Uncharacterized protein n=1 Tax=Boletus reticuloceps TaxID=495285 RepID=A0A8I2YEA3_9AGAM|nr:hypothetical protein JVT61DRAFT_12399 [Boletus reticuloceps]